MKENIDCRNIYITQKKKNVALEFEIKEIKDLFEYPKHFGRPHKHDFYFILFLVEGNSKQRVDFNEIEVSKNQLVFMYPGQVHAFKYNEKVKGFTLYFTDDFIDNTSSSTYDLHHILYNNNQVLNLKKEQVDELSFLINDIQNEFNNNFINKKELLKAQLEVFLTKILRYYHTNQTITYTKEDFFKLIELQSEYFNKEISVSDIAQVVNLTPKTLNAKTKKYFGKTFLQFLNEKKELEIKKMLSTTDLSIKEIAYEMGFTDSAHLNNYFKKRIGITPLNFRKETMR